MIPALFSLKELIDPDLFGGVTVTVGVEIYASPAPVIVNDVIVPLTPTVAVAVAPTSGLGIVTTGGVAYPVPTSVTLNLITPAPVVTSCAVAAAPTPPPPEIVILGGDV